MPPCFIPRLGMMMEKVFFFVVEFSFLMSTQIMNFPFCFGIITIDDSHVTSSIGCMKPDVNSLSKFCFTIAA